MKKERKARVSLSPENIRQLLRGESLHIRLRNVVGEAQILEVQSPCNPPQTKSVQRMASDLLEQFNDIMNITGKGEKVNAKERRNRQST